MKLSDRDWRSFCISGEKGIFEIYTTSSGIDKNKLILGSEEIPYITRAQVNNGVNLFIPKNQKNKYKMDLKNVITIGLDTQTVFYQPYKFYTGQNIQILKNSNLNKYNAMFIIPLLKVQMDKFNWGGNGATISRLARTNIMLPVSNQYKNVPDWHFMEEYVRKYDLMKKNEYINYILKKIKNINYKKIENLEEKKWSSFNIKDLFSHIQRGKRLTKKNQIKGNIPYISSSSVNNGVDNFISNDKKVRKFKNCLSLANSGSVGSTFYQPFEFIASDHITHLKNEIMNEYVYLFIATLTNRLGEKYNFNREINDLRISKEKIILPILENDQPDYKYMEQYMKNIMYEKYEKYLSNFNIKFDK